MSEAELKLVELDPNKQYVVMFKGYPDNFKWEDKPTNVSSILLNADHFTIEDLDAAREALSNLKTPKLEEGDDASLKALGADDGE